MVQIIMEESCKIYNKMAYINTQTNEIGNLKQLLPNVSNPEFLSESELLERNIEKYIEPVVEATLEELKDHKKSEIKQTLEQIQKEGCLTTLGFKIDFQKENRDDFTGGLLLMQNAGLTEMSIRDFDNVNHMLSSEEYTQMCLEMGQYYNNLLSEKWTLDDLLSEATTKEEVEAIYWRNAIYEDEEELEISHYEYNPILGRE